MNPPSSHIILLGFGSNVGDRLANIQAALDHLKPVIRITAISNAYENAALLPENAPPEWNIAFINIAVAALTDLSPHALLEHTQAAEHATGRQKRGHWGPREVDVDILAYDDMVLQTPTLTLPHSQLDKRNFVLLPLNDIAPHWQHPATKQSIAQMAASIGHEGIIRVFDYEHSRYE
jgi:2-amino-4-hydroxy-6-hydroxymethyldihydropteridine diphosphokinase